MPRLLLLACLIAGTLALAAGCGPRGGSGGGNATRFVGQISVAGPTPFAAPRLTTGDGTVYEIVDSDLGTELGRLAGMDVAVSAQLLDTPKGRLPRIEVFGYELLPLPTGEQPLLGVIGGTPPHDVWLQDRAGKRWIIVGSLRAVLEDFFGAKVWIVGDVSSGDAGVTIDVKGYGIIRPASP